MNKKPTAPSDCQKQTAHQKHKWASFYLAEHASTFKTVVKTQHLEQQTVEQIDYYLNQSIKYNKILEIHLNPLTDKQRPIWGIYTGSVNLDTIAITDPISGFRYLEYATIRHIKTHDFKKWSTLVPLENPFE